MLLTGALASCRKPIASEPMTAEAPAWIPLTGSWTGTEGGEVTEGNGVLHLAFGEMLTAAKWTGAVPEAPFELEYETRRVNGADFFGAVTFPARKDEHVTFVLGGWGGGLVGISSIDHMDASENETGTNMKFETGQWYRIRLSVTGGKIEAWIDDQKVVDVSIAGRTLSLRPGPISACLPFGFGTWQSTGEVRGAKWRSL
jgi:hypothetical protein